MAQRRWERSWIGWILSQRCVSSVRGAGCSPEPLPVMKQWYRKVLRTSARDETLVQEGCSHVMNRVRLFLIRIGASSNRHLVYST